MLNDVLILYKHVTLKISQRCNTDLCKPMSTSQLWKAKKDNEEKDGSWPSLTSYIQYKYLCNKSKFVHLLPAVQSYHSL